MIHTKSLYTKGIVQNRAMLTQSQFSQITFIGHLDNTKVFYNALNAVNFNEDVTIILSDNGLKAVVEDAKYVQASVYVTKGCFTDYQLQSTEEVSIRVHLGVICECLSIFAGVDCSMKIIYKGEGAPLVFVLEQHGEDDLVTECSIKTKNAQPTLDFALDDECASFNSIILRGPDFAQLLSEINRSADELELYMSPTVPYFKISTLGVVQSDSTLQVAKSSDMMLMFACKQMCSVRYKMSHIRIPMKAIGLATKVAVRTDGSGLLSMQMMVLSEENAQIYVEYFVTPLTEEEDF